MKIQRQRRLDEDTEDWMKIEDWMKTLDWMKIQRTGWTG